MAGNRGGGGRGGRIEEQVARPITDDKLPSGERIQQPECVAFTVDQLRTKMSEQSGREYQLPCHSRGWYRSIRQNVGNHW
eukprot:2997534-Heterocapsa_arctica.AAC.1